MRRLILSTVLAVLASCCFGSAAGAVALEPIGKFEQPISVTSDPENSNRLLVAEREGRVMEVGPEGTRTIADLTDLITCCLSERGLLSIAPAPDFHSSGRFYVAYTGTPAAGGAVGDVQIDSFRPDPGGGPPIREPILSVGHAINPNHNGGQLQFGPDGRLYISLGDGGGGGDMPGNAQNTEVLLGKVLRIDPRPEQAPAYAVPPDNPFVAKPGEDEIWAYGLRNPWRFSFDRTTGDMVIGDVGQGAREEVDYAPSPGGGVVSGGGANYGWNCREGFIAYTAPAPTCGSAAAFTEPVFDYEHDDPENGSTFGCSIIGGYVVRDHSLGDLYGRYVYTDYCTQDIRSLVLPAEAGGTASDDRSEGLTVATPTSFGEDACGRLYVASEEGTVYRLAGATPPVCPVAAAPDIAAAVGPTGQGLGVERKHEALRLRLHGRLVGDRLKIFVEATPCAGQAGDRVQLNRGGQRLSSRPLNDRCIARFFARVKSIATFRALLIGSEEIRSQRFAVEPHRTGSS